MWEVVALDQFREWYLGLSDDEADRVTAAVELLGEEGPSLARPHADRISSSRHHNMKELRTRHGDDQFRILFAFDPIRRAVLIIGGSKTGQWNRWYDEHVPLADDLYDTYLQTLDTGQEPA